MKQKNATPQPCHDESHKKGNPQASRSSTLRDGDKAKKGGGGTVKNVY
jgi:hypothetical protein